MRTALKKDTILKDSGKQVSYTIDRLLSDSGGSALTYYAVRDDHQLVVLKELYPMPLAFLLRNEDGGIDVPEDYRDMMQYFVSIFLEEAEQNQILQQKFASQILPGANAKLAPEYVFASAYAFEATNGMRYIEISTSKGKSLAEKQYFKASDCIEDLLKLCEVVNALHNLGEGYLHLDLKPSNVFFTSSNNIKLLDFSSLLRKGEQYQRHFSCSPGFSAPELLPEYRRIIEDSSITTSCDCYSVTAILYWMLFGHALEEEKVLYTSEIDLRFLPREDFPEMLKGHSYQAIERTLKILRKGLSFYPQNRYQNISELKGDLQKLLENCEAYKREIPAKNTDEFIKRIAGVDDFIKHLPFKSVDRCVDCVVERKKPKHFEGCCLTCELMHAYIEQHLESEFPKIRLLTLPEACVTSVETLYIHPSNCNYALGLFCLRMLHKGTDIEAWQSYAQHHLFHQLRNLAAKEDNQKVLAEYPAGTGVHFRHDILEARFDFDGMIKNVEGFLEYEFGTKDIKEISLDNNQMNKDVASCAGMLAEALCLKRKPKWTQKVPDILHYVYIYTRTQDRSFRDRTVDILLHFALEKGDRKLFTKTLALFADEQEQAEHRLYKAVDMKIEQWIPRVAEGFIFLTQEPDTSLTDGDGYSLYLYLKALNTLFADEVCEHKEILKKMANSILTKVQSTSDKLGLSRHPWELVLKHMGLLSKKLSLPEMTMNAILILEEFLENNLTHNKKLSIVTLITEAAILCLDSNEKRLARIKADIKSGVAQGIFSKAYFEDVTKSGSTREEILSKFRFKHT